MDALREQYRQKGFVFPRHFMSAVNRIGEWVQRGNQRVKEPKYTVRPHYQNLYSRLGAVGNPNHPIDDQFMLNFLNINRTMPAVCGVDFTWVIENPDKPIPDELPAELGF